MRLTQIVIAERVKMFCLRCDSISIYIFSTSKHPDFFAFANVSQDESELINE